MARNTRQSSLRWVSYVLPDRLANWTLRRFARRVVNELRGGATDAFLELLLRGMDLAFNLSRGFRRNIENFDARYVFRTADGRVHATADFANGDMKVDRRAEDRWSVRVTFANTRAFQTFLFSKDQDILNSVLANEVEVDGNLNYIYKFGFMARDLARRLGVL
ncbi:MAG: hypothetical protein JSU86_13800 [Phycisphaerales bacterium]|nr:MAG: hypothetical protein JSU86_13800 [Phycisphaerales bacterium]